MEKSSRLKNRYFSAILYEEDPNYNKYVESIYKYYTEITYILHDKDVTEDGELKKAHYHYLFRVGKNARHIKSIATESEIPIQYLEGVNKENYLLYMIHYKKPKKHQYKVEEVKGELKEMVKTLMQEKREDKEKLEEILNKITNYEIRNQRELLKYCIENNCVDIIKKYGYILLKCL